MYQEGAVLAAALQKRKTKLAAEAKVGATDFDWPLYLLAVGKMFLSKVGYLNLLPTLRNDFVDLVNEIFSQNWDSRNDKDSWSRYIKFLANACGYAAPTEQEYLKPNQEELSELASIVAHFFNESSDESYYLIVDDLFYRAIDRNKKIDRRHAEHVGALANQFGGFFGEYFDYFPSTGEISIQSRFSHNDDRRLAYLNSRALGNTEFALRLRLATRHINIESVEDSAQALRGKFLVIDSPGQTTASLEMLNGQISNNSSLIALKNILANNTNFSLALVVLNQIDARSTGFRQKIREELIQSRKFLAAIDFSTYGLQGTRKKVTAWIVASRPQDISGVLCVDGKWLSRPEVLGESRDVQSVFGRIALEWLSSQNGFNFDARQLVLPLLDERIDRFIKTVFLEEYQDVEGLCRTVSFEEIEANKFSLVASQYITSHAPPKWPSKLDNRDILEILTSRTSNPCRIYLIGDNGIGKSLMLREIVQELDATETSTVALAFGFADRFDLKYSAESKILYRGARTSEAGINRKKTSESLFNLIQTVFVNENSLEIFNQITALIGFHYKHFLVPILPSSVKFDAIGTSIDDVRSLSSDAKNNADLFNSISASKYKLGMIRDNSSDAIIPFDELSSGEQQVLTLIVKALANVEAGMVVLVDEPEISLHVAWQQAIPRVLEKISNAIGCSFVVATHSPVIIASATSSNDYCFSASEQGLERLEREKRGSVEAALFESFGTYTVNNRRIFERPAEIIARVIKGLDGNPESEAQTIANALRELEAMSEKISLNQSVSEQNLEEFDLIAKARRAIIEIAPKYSDKKQWQ